MFTNRVAKAPVARAGAVVGVLLGALGAGEVLAQPGATSYVDARVIDVEPIVRQVTVQRPRRECWEETVYERAPGGPNVTGQTLAGALVGAAIGRQFGGGSGRDAATVAGALAGTVVANERAQRLRAERGEGQVYAVPVERCEVVQERHTEERVEGYWVTYVHQGQRYRSRTSRQPGEHVRLRVTVQPIGL